MKRYKVTFKSSLPLYLLPGLILLGAGVSALLFPKLLIYLVASIMIVAGTTLCILGYRLVQFQRQFEERVKAIDSAIRIHIDRGEILQELRKDDNIILH